MKAEKRIENMENRFNNLVEDFQKYIDKKEKDIAEKEKIIQQLRDKKQENTHPDHMNIDEEEQNTAVRIYSEILEDYTIPQERDEVMLDTVEKYIYDRKQPNIAYGVWEQSDFSHCGNVEKSYKLMRALLQD